MSTFRRYDMILGTKCGEGWQELEPADEGEWMRYEDHAPIQDALKAMIERFAPFIETRGDEEVIDRAKAAIDQPSSLKARRKAVWDARSI